MSTKPHMSVALHAWIVKFRPSATALSAASISPYHLRPWRTRKREELRIALRAVVLVVISRIEYLTKGHPSLEEVNPGGTYDLYVSLMRSELSSLFKGQWW